MAVSRRFESRFMVSFSRYTVDIASLRAVTALASGAAATAAAPAIGVPPSGRYAFQARYSAGWGVQAFIAENRMSAANGLGPYPASAAAWDDAAWGRAPHIVRWYDDNNTPRLAGSATGRCGPATHTIGARTVRYRMFLSFWHQVEVVNNSAHPVTAYHRGYSSHTFKADGDFGSIVMSPWASTQIAAGAAAVLGGFEPLELKFNETSTDRELLGITAQNGDRTLLLF